MVWVGESGGGKDRGRIVPTNHRCVIATGARAVITAIRDRSTKTPKKRSGRSSSRSVEIAGGVTIGLQRPTWIRASFHHLTAIPCARRRGTNMKTAGATTASVTLDGETIGGATIALVIHSGPLMAMSSAPSGANQGVRKNALTAANHGNRNQRVLPGMVIARSHLSGSGAPLRVDKTRASLPRPSRPNFVAAKAGRSRVNSVAAKAGRSRLNFVAAKAARSRRVRVAAEAGANHETTSRYGGAYRAVHAQIGPVRARACGVGPGARARPAQHPADQTGTHRA